MTRTLTSAQIEKCVDAAVGPLGDDASGRASRRVDRDQLIAPPSRARGGARTVAIRPRSTRARIPGAAPRSTSSAAEASCTLTPASSSTAKHQASVSGSSVVAGQRVGVGVQARAGGAVFRNRLDEVEVLRRGARRSGSSGSGGCPATRWTTGVIGLGQSSRSQRRWQRGAVAVARLPVVRQPPLGSIRNRAQPQVMVPHEGFPPAIGRPHDIGAGLSRRFSLRAQVSSPRCRSMTGRRR